MTQSHYGGLEVEEDMKWERSSWVVERVIWVGFLVVLVAGLFGLFGPGAFGFGDVKSGELSVHYPHFARYTGKTDIQATVPVNGQDEVRVILGSDYLQSMALEDVHPQADTVESSATENVYVFKAAEGAKSMTVTFKFKPEQIGKVDGSLRVEGGPEVSFTHFIYP